MTSRRQARLDAREVELVEATARALDAVPAQAPAAALFDALRPCVPPLEGGTFSILRPGSRDPVVSYGVRLPPGLFETWISTPPEVLAPAVAPVLQSADGGLLLDSQSITGELRERFEPIRTMHAAGLGEGAGYKVLARKTPWSGVEHFMLAMIMARGDPVPPRAGVLLGVLNASIRDAVLRAGLPLVARDSILAQLVEEQSIGYLCLSRDRRLLEANRRAIELILRYAARAGVSGRQMVADFAGRALDRAPAGKAWYLAGHAPPSLLQVNRHRLAKETHALREDVTLVVLTELDAPPAPSGPPVLARLTPRQQEIALLVAHTSLSYKEAADRLGLEARTVHKHMENIHRILGVRSRAELSVLLKPVDPPQG
ncbi:Hypothetical protein A7982_09385 [Minicystis rosea]|nr:Hypothetical protein A7982_09385 [Minicystis rosea]